MSFLMKPTRRTFLATSAGFAAYAQVPDSIKNLRSMMDNVKPITEEERRGRVEKARRLMAEHKIGALVCENGASMFYFTGKRSNSVLVMPAKGDLAWFEPDSYQK